jgi:hypothetical protein
MTFKKGDIITGKEGADNYLYTTSNAIMKVVNVVDEDDNDIKVKILRTKDGSTHSTSIFSVQSRYFELYEQAPPTTPKAKLDKRWRVRL